MLSTIHRRHVLSYIKEQRNTTFRKLKEKFIDTKEMNPTTLYRILERFQDEGICHVFEIGGERYYCLCSCETQKDPGFKITYCTSCHVLTDSHFPLEQNSLKSESIEYLKSCSNCR